ncbi:MAG: tRNA threonylcarbamoyladenosine dehydratase [Alloprevotella sp.]|nr:tRNA threonylcarbamoyladenosine dehydratase [Alloprevotella sp.]
MQHTFSRTQLLLGEAAMKTLQASRVAVFGVGGVGGYVVEALVRSGIGALDIVDDDRVCPTNLNRQIIALHSTVGQYKVDVAEARIRDINPHCRVTKHQQFYLPENADAIDLSPFDYVVDCIDTVTAKLELIRRCHALGVPIISCMGAANKMDATAFRVTDITKTKMDPLAKVIRRKLRQLRIPRLKCVWSEEEPLQPLTPAENSPEEETGLHAKRRSIPASNAFVPATAGLITGGEVVKDLLRKAGTYRLTT